MALRDLAEKGVRKYRGKIDQMERSYEASESRAKSHYEDLPFGPTVTGNYKDAWKFMVDNYKTAIKPEKADTWRENWISKMKE